MIPGLIVIVAGVILLWGGSAFTKRRNTIDREGISTLGTLTSIYPIEGGGVQLEIRFTDQKGEERTGMSQKFKKTDGRYKAGDRVPITYQLKKTLGMTAVRLRVQDDVMKQAGGGTIVVLRIMGVACIVVGVILFFLV